MVLNDAVEENNGSDIMIYAEGDIHALLKFKSTGSLKDLLLLKTFASLGIITPVYALYGTVAENS